LALPPGGAAAPARRLNYDIVGFRTLLMKTAQAVEPPYVSDAKVALIRIDPRWEDIRYWAAMKRASGPLGLFYLLTALDLEQTPTGEVVRRSPEDAIYLDVFRRTMEISLVVTVLCLLLGFPVAYLLASVPHTISNRLLIIVLVPFWTSLLVRTAAWVVLLQNNGIVNEVLSWLRVVSTPAELIYNRIGVYISMTHVLLPFMILALYSVMKGISPNYMRAAASLGASPLRSFLTVYLPLCQPGIGSGCVLVFIPAIGYFIIPELIGGGDDQMISHFIAFYTNNTINWGLAAALSAVLLACTLGIYLGCIRFLGADRVNVG
jgi:putative spermidine/putrescine transport system permease protein